MAEEKNYKLLIVDDSEINREILENMLEGDFEITKAEDGIQALNMLKQPDHGIDLCLLDIMMPKLDGFEVLLTMNKEHIIDDVPVIVISGEQEVSKVEKAYDLGAVDYITKPFDARIVRRRVLATVMLYEKQKELSDRLKRQMEVNLNKIDELTGLPTYAAFFTSCDKLIESGAINEKYFMVAIDIEHFRLFNDWFGRSEGDSYIKELADCLLENCDGIKSIAGYLGGDNFALFAPYNVDLIDTIQDRMLLKLNTYGQVMGFCPMYGIFEVNPGKGGYTAQLMYDNAVTAMADIPGNYNSRIAIYDPKLLLKTGDELKLLSDVQRGMDAKEFTFFMQPKVNMLNGKIVGAEALVRWAHKSKGIVNPGAFVPVLEDNGFITNLDRYVWEEVCRWQRGWIDRGNEAIPISVNVSQIDIFAGDVADYFLSLIKRYDLQPSMIDIEITESAYAKEFELITKTVDKFREAGFKVLLDDFGSAYSSLNMLGKLKVDVLKLDMKFLETSEDEEKGFSILDSVVGMANQIGVPMIVEGVERREQVEVLTNIGCVYAQGFYFYKPMPVKRFEDLIKDRNKVEYEEDRVMPKSYKPLQIIEFLQTNLISDSMVNNVLGPFAFFEKYGDKLSIVRVNDQFYKMTDIVGEMLEDAVIAVGDQILANNDNFLELFETAADSNRKCSEGVVDYVTPHGRETKLYFRVFFLHEREGRQLFCSTIWDIEKV